MKYQAKPVSVDAHIIMSVGPILPDGSMHCALQNGENGIASKEMISRFIPGEGDFWVIQEDGYVYLNPSEVFLRKYEPLRPEPAQAERRTLVSRELCQDPTLHIDLCCDSLTYGVDIVFTKDDLRLSRWDFSERFLLPAATQLIGRVLAEVKP